ncbi:MAG TPA: L,D-transpeptidase family protein [Stellaceae bacterium]|nr:L,D-transpeptidase family protein [Stellaceae bacterium]
MAIAFRSLSSGRAPRGARGLALPVPGSGSQLLVHPAGEARWRKRRFRCALGRAGVLAEKREGDGGTPAGLWPMRDVWFRADRLAMPATHLPCRALDPADGWCDDPADPFYNRHVRLPYPASCERLWREDRLYDLIVPLGYNDDPVIPGRGSAIFLHVARADVAPTAGCVGLALADLLVVLREAEPGATVRVLAE